MLHRHPHYCYCCMRIVCVGACVYICMYVYINVFYTFMLRSIIIIEWCWLLFHFVFLFALYRQPQNDYTCIVLQSSEFCIVPVNEFVFVWLSHCLLACLSFCPYSYYNAYISSQKMWLYLCFIFFKCVSS